MSVVTDGAGGSSVTTVISRVRRGRVLLLIACLVLLVVLLLVGIAIGSRTMPLRAAWDALWSYDPANDDHRVVRSVRIWRTLLAVVVGIALGAAGVVMQAMTRNPLAEPGLLGINAGASAAVVTAIMLGFDRITHYVWFGFAGAAGAGLLVLALAGTWRGGHNPVKLTLAGAALSVVFGAFALMIVINYPQNFVEFVNWSVGGFQGRGRSVFVPIAIFVAVGVLGALALAGPLDAVALGNDTAKGLGVRPGLIWGLATLVVVLLAGSATAAAGPIAFVGLVAPHLARLIVGPTHQWLLPTAMVLGALTLLAADIVGRVVVRPSEVQAGIIAAIVGGPFFIAVVRRRRIAQL